LDNVTFADSGGFTVSGNTLGSYSVARAGLVVPIAGVIFGDGTRFGPGTSVDIFNNIFHLATHERGSLCAGVVSDRATLSPNTTLSITGNKFLPAPNAVALGWWMHGTEFSMSIASSVSFGTAVIRIHGNELAQDTVLSVAGLHDVFIGNNSWHGR
jgi:hypothetical protein